MQQFLEKFLCIAAQKLFLYAGDSVHLRAQLWYTVIMELFKSAKIGVRSFVWLACLYLAGCGVVPNSSHPFSDTTMTSYESPMRQKAQDLALASVEQGQPMEQYYPEYIDVSKVAVKDRKVRIRLGLGRDESKAMGCNLTNRFDRSAALAYNFDDHQSRVSLHLSLDGPSLSNPGNVGFNSVMVRYTHKFQKPAKRKGATGPTYVEEGHKGCLYPSKVQGFLGSAFNEMFLRTNYTILDELKDRGLNLK